MDEKWQKWHDLPPERKESVYQKMLKKSPEKAREFVRGYVRWKKALGEGPAVQEPKVIDASAPASAPAQKKEKGGPFSVQLPAGAPSPDFATEVPEKEGPGLLSEIRTHGFDPTIGAAFRGAKEALGEAGEFWGPHLASGIDPHATFEPPAVTEQKEAPGFKKGAGEAGEVIGEGAVEAAAAFAPVPGTGLLKAAKPVAKLFGKAATKMGGGAKLVKEAEALGRVGVGAASGAVAGVSDALLFRPDVGLGEAAAAGAVGGAGLTALGGLLADFLKPRNLEPVMSKEVREPWMKSEAAWEKVSAKRPQPTAEGETILKRGNKLPAGRGRPLLAAENPAAPPPAPKQPPAPTQIQTPMPKGMVRVRRYSKANPQGQDVYVPRTEFHVTSGIEPYAKLDAPSTMQLLNEVADSPVARWKPDMTDWAPVAPVTSVRLVPGEMRGAIARKPTAEVFYLNENGEHSVQRMVLTPENAAALAKASKKDGFGVVMDPQLVKAKKLKKEWLPIQQAFDDVEELVRAPKVEKEPPPKVEVVKVVPEESPKKLLKSKPAKTARTKAESKWQEAQLSKELGEFSKFAAKMAGPDYKPLSKEYKRAMYAIIKASNRLKAPDRSPETVKQALLKMLAEYNGRGPHWQEFAVGAEDAIKLIDEHGLKYPVDMPEGWKSTVETELPENVESLVKVRTGRQRKKHANPVTSEVAGADVTVNKKTGAMKLHPVGPANKSNVVPIKSGDKVLIKDGDKEYLGVYAGEDEDGILFYKVSEGPKGPKVGKVKQSLPEGASAKRINPDTLTMEELPTKPTKPYKMSLFGDDPKGKKPPEQLPPPHIPVESIPMLPPPSADNPFRMPPNVEEAVLNDFRTLAEKKKGGSNSFARWAMSNGILGAPAYAARKMSFMSSRLVSRWSEDVLDANLKKFGGALGKRGKIDRRSNPIILSKLDKRLNQVWNGDFDPNLGRVVSLKDIHAEFPHVTMEALSHFSKLMQRRTRLDANIRALLRDANNPQEWLDGEWANYSTLSYMMFILPEGQWVKNHLGVGAFEKNLREGANWIYDTMVREGLTFAAKNDVQPRPPSVDEIVSELLKFAKDRSYKGGVLKHLLARKNKPAALRAFLGELESAFLNSAITLGNQEGVYNRLKLLKDSYRGAIAGTVPWTSALADKRRGLHYPVETPWGTYFTTQDMGEAIEHSSEIHEASWGLIREFVAFQKMNEIALGGLQPIVNSMVGNLTSHAISGAMFSKHFPKANYLAWRAMYDFSLDPTGNTGMGYLLREARTVGADVFGLSHMEVGNPKNRKVLKKLVEVLPVEGETNVNILAKWPRHVLEATKSVYGTYRDVGAWAGQGLDLTDRHSRLAAFITFRRKLAEDLAKNGSNSWVAKKGFLKSTNLEAGLEARSPYNELIFREAARSLLLKDSTDGVLRLAAGNVKKALPAPTIIPPGQQTPPSMPLIGPGTFEPGQEEIRQTGHAINEAAAWYVNQYFLNPVFTGNLTEKVRKGMVGLGARYFTTAAGVATQQFNIIKNLVKGYDPAAVVRAGIAAGAVYGAMQGYSAISGITKEQHEAVAAAIPEYRTGYSPGAYTMAYIDDTGQYVVHDFTRSLDLLRHAVGAAEDPVLKKFAINLLLMPVEGGMGESAIRQALSSFDLAQASPQFRDELSENWKQKVYKLLRAGSLIPGLAHSAMEAGRRSGLFDKIEREYGIDLPDMRGTEEKLPPYLAILRAAGYSALNVVSSSEAENPTTRASWLEWKRKRNAIMAERHALNYKDRSSALDKLEIDRRRAELNERLKEVDARYRERREKWKNLKR